MVAQTTPVTIIFPAGIYKYSVSPNWANYDVSIQAEGMVRLRYTGTDNAVIIDGGAAVTSRYNVSFLGNFCVEATSAAKNGYFVRAIQHSKIEGRVDGCGATYAGLRVEFCVCTEFSVRTTINQIGAWYTGAQPENGIYVTNRGDPLEQTTACTFINPIIEGVSGDGIVLDHASNNIFIAGTSEGNTGLGILATANSTSNLIQGVDFEVNTAGDIEDYGFNNTYFRVNSISSVILASDNAKFLNCTLNSVVDNGLATSFVSTTYNTLGTGTLTGTAAQQSLYNLRNDFVGYFEQNKTYDSIVNPSVTLPHNTATTVLTIDVTGINGNRYYQVTVYKVGLGTAYAAYALVYRDGSTCYIVSQTNGLNLTLTVSGLNILATQNSGAPITGFFAKASAI